MDDVEAKNLFARTGITLGETLDGRYQVVEILGRGGMGTVFRAINLSLNKPVAVKALHMSLDQFAELRFKQEIKAMSMLSHPHLISVLDAGTTPGGTPYFVMEFLDGPALGDLLKTQGVLPDVRAIRMFIQMADALAYAHEQGIIHRDLKPNNVVVLSNRGKDFIKLVDLGIAKLLTPGDQQGLTVTGEIFGSPIYMSPEQCSARDVDARSDVYSLGCLMFETICGEPPIKGGSALETFNLHMTAEAPLLSAVPGMHMTPTLKALEPVIARCVKIRPEDRIQTMAELAEALERIDRLGGAAGQSSDSSSSTKPPQSARVNPRASMTPDAQNEIGSTVITGANKASSDSINRPARVQQTADQRGSQTESPLANKNLLVGVGVFAVVLIVGIGFSQVRNMLAPPVPPAAVQMPTFSPPMQVNQSPVDYEKLAKEMAAKQMARRCTVSYPENSSKSKVEVVAVYMGKNQEGGNPQLPGDVQVDVKYSDKPVTLVLVSYMPVNWKIMRDGPAVKISRIMVSSYFTPTTVTGVPAGVQVEKAWFPFLAEDGRKLDHPRTNPFEVFSMGTSLNPGSESVEGSSDFQNMKKIVETHLGEPLKSFQGAYSDDHFTVR